METFAWIGVGAAGMFCALFAVIWTVGWLRDPIGRVIAAGIAILALIAWGVLGGIYLAVTHGG